MLKCSLHIRVCNIFYLILHLTKQNLFTLWPLSFYADMEHYVASQDSNIEKILFLSTYKKNYDEYGIKRTFYAGTQHVWELSDNYSRNFYFSFTPTTNFFPHKLDISTGENIVQLSLPKVQPATEQSIMTDMYRGVASIAFCLQFYYYKYFIFLQSSDRHKVRSQCYFFCLNFIMKSLCGV